MILLSRLGKLEKKIKNKNVISQKENKHKKKVTEEKKELLQTNLSF